MEKTFLGFPMKEGKNSSTNWVKLYGPRDGEATTELLSCRAMTYCSWLSSATRGIKKTQEYVCIAPTNPQLPAA